jgi:hypothetical protein
VQQIRIGRCVAQHEVGHHYVANIVQLMIEKGAQQYMDWNIAMYNAVEGGYHYVANIVQLIIEKDALRSAQRSID